MWWMDENDESNGESWLREENTEDDKKKFFEALENNEVDLSADDDDDDEELLESINDLNSQIDKLQTPYDAESHAESQSMQDSLQNGQDSSSVQVLNVTRDAASKELSFDGESFVEQSISSLRDAMESDDNVQESGQVTPRLENLSKEAREEKEDSFEYSELDKNHSFMNGIDYEKMEDDAVISKDLKELPLDHVKDTEIKSGLEQNNVLGNFESDDEEAESQDLDQPLNKSLEHDKEKSQIEYRNEKDGMEAENKSHSFASFEESTILLDTAYNQKDENQVLPQQEGSLDLQDKEKNSLVIENQKLRTLEDTNNVEVDEIESMKSMQDNNSFSQKSGTTKKGIKVDKEELLRFQSTINDLEYQVKELEQALSRKEKESDSLKKESTLLESILEKEQANSKRLLSRIGGNNQADLIQLRKEVEDQERLIHGYQLENERLIDQNKDLKMQLKESEKKELLKSEKLLREISALKTQLSERERFQTRSELGVATYQLQIETLEQELQSLKSSSLENSEYQKAEIEKLKAMLKEVNKSNKTRDQAENSTFTSSKEYLEMKDKYDAQIIQLEQKLKWHTENQEMIDDLKKEIVMKDSRIKNLEESFDQLGLSSASKKDLRRRSLVDIQRINNLEAELKKLKEMGTKSRSNVVLEPHNDDKKDVINLLESKVSILNEANEQLSRDAEVRFRSLQQEYNGLRIQYEKNMEEMEQRLHDFEKNDDEALKANISELEMALKEKDKQLEQASESHVRKRVLELESLLDEQTNIYMALLKEKSDLKEQMIKLTREREKLIDSYEAQVDGMEKALRDKLFAVEEMKHFEEINDLKLKREADQREILDLKTRQEFFRLIIRLEISEKTRSSVQDTTLVILKQAQEESAKIAMAHHERSLKSFLTEIRAETGQKSRQDEELESQLSEALLTVDKLQKANFELECSNASLSDQIKALSAQLNSLQSANSNLETIIRDTKNSWPPSQQIFEGLKERIRELEAASNKRESDIVSLLEESRISAAQELAQEKRDLLKILSRKDAEIISFKQELESLMGMIIRLKNEKF